MEAAQEQAYGTTFKKSVGKLVDGVGRMGFVPADLKERLNQNATKLCDAEAAAEKAAVELAKKAKAEWDGKYAETAKATLTSVSELAKEQAKLLKGALARFTK